MSEADLPYRWYPMGTIDRDPEIAMLVAYNHRVFRVVLVEPVAQSAWTARMREDVANRPHLVPVRVHLRPAQLPLLREVGAPVPLADARDWFGAAYLNARQFHAYQSEHYPACGHCQEPLPCRKQMVERTAQNETTRTAKFATSGVCPACGEKVSSRQLSGTFDENLVIKGGPPVTFHLRRGCKDGAASYERKWAAGQARLRKITLSCKGSLIVHNDGTYECSNWHSCPGSAATHWSMSVCRCVECHARGDFGCYPRRPNLTRRLTSSAHEDTTDWPEGIHR